MMYRIGRSLENYKKLHANLAQKLGKYEEFQRCYTLTQARKILFGYKSKTYRCCKGRCYQCI